MSAAKSAARLRFALRVFSRKRFKRHGVGWWDGIAVEGTARTMRKLLDERDRNVLVCDFENSDVDYVLIFARGERATEVRDMVRALTLPPAPGTGAP